MVAALLSLLGPLLGPLLAGLAVIIAILGVYFGVKHKGVVQERERQEAKRTEEIVKVQEKVQVAISKDSQINIKIQNEITKINEEVVPVPAPSSPDKFRF